MNCTLLFTCLGGSPVRCVMYVVDVAVIGTDLVIGGVHIPYHMTADAHSDGDALYHCVVDAILGALNLPDIGQIFPDNDPTWKGADSSIFMIEVIT